MLVNWGAVGFVNIVILVGAGSLGGVAGALAGGFAGGKLIGVLPAMVVRSAIVALGTVMTAAYAWRYWLA